MCVLSCIYILYPIKVTSIVLDLQKIINEGATNLFMTIIFRRSLYASNKKMIEHLESRKFIL